MTKVEKEILKECFSNVLREKFAYYNRLNEKSRNNKNTN